MLETKTDESDNAARIIVAGMDGAGNNAINRTINESITGIEFIGVDTDKQALQFCKAPAAMWIGEKLTKGLDTGVRPDVGERVVGKSPEEASQALEGVNMVFVACGMDDSIGTSATPVIAKIAKDMDILTVGVVAKPFRSEAKARTSSALEGIENLENSIDISIVIPNDRLLEIVDRRTIMPDALKRVGEVLQQAAQGVTDLINAPGLTNLDFADVQTAMIGRGIAHIGIGRVKSGNKATEAAKQTISSPLLETTIGDASHVVANISGDISLIEIDKTASYAQELVGDEASIMFGATCDENTQDGANIAVTATGSDEHGTSVSMPNAMKGFISSSRAKPGVIAATIWAPHAVAPETAATASSPYSRQNQGYTPGFDPSSLGNQDYNPLKYNPNQGYDAGSTQNLAPASGQPFRFAVNKGMQINIPDFLKNKR